MRAAACTVLSLFAACTEVQTYGAAAIEQRREEVEQLGDIVPDDAPLRSVRKHDH